MYWCTALLYFLVILRHICILSILYSLCTAKITKKDGNIPGIQCNIVPFFILYFEG